MWFCVYRNKNLLVRAGNASFWKVTGFYHVKEQKGCECTTSDTQWDFAIA